MSLLKPLEQKLEEDEANNGQSIPGIAHPAHLSKNGGINDR